jgi:hypothetical protein
MIAIAGIVLFNVLVVSLLVAVAVSITAELREARWRRMLPERPAPESRHAEQRRAA